MVYDGNGNNCLRYMGLMVVDKLKEILEEIDEEGLLEEDVDMPREVNLKEALVRLYKAAKEVVDENQDSD